MIYSIHLLFLGMDDNINMKNIIRGKSIALIILMILACSLLTGDAALIIPSILFIGILCGMMKKDTMNEVLLRSIITFVVASVLTMIVSLINVYYSEGGLYAIANNNNNQQGGEQTIRVRSPRKGEIPGVVEQILGHGKLKVRCNDKNIRLCRIPGKMKKRICS